MPSPRSTTRLHRASGSSHKTVGENEVEPGDWDAISIFRRKYNIPALKIDQSHWDKKWEKTLRTLSASKDVFAEFAPYWLGNKSIGVLPLFSGMSDGLRKAVCRFREVVMEFEEILQEPSAFVTLWLLLDEAERKRYLFKSMKETCEHVSLHYDARALCPEITTTAMLKHSGRAFTNFARDFVKATREAGPDNVYFLPSEWWSSAVNKPEPWPEDVKFVFTQLSLQRHEFISHFIVRTLMLVVHDMAVGSPSASMDKATDLIDTDSRVALSWANMLSTKLDKPLIRCENCTKTREQIGGNPKFMICSICKYKLDFVVHYCSRTCQKDDWRNHKEHCGKEKITKKLPGTIHDQSWEFPHVSEQFRFTETPPDDDVPITSLGFGTPHPSHPLSSALQRQVALLEEHRNVDYFLFDGADRPIAIMLEQSHLKTAFRVLRPEAIFGANELGVAIIAELLIKIAACWPGLSKAMILAQFEREYGRDIAAMVAAYVAKRAENRKGDGETCLEAMSAGFRTLEATGFPGLTL